MKCHTHTTALDGSVDESLTVQVCFAKGKTYICAVLQGVRECSRKSNSFPLLQVTILFCWLACCVMESYVKNQALPVPNSLQTISSDTLVSCAGGCGKVFRNFKDRSRPFINNVLTSSSLCFGFYYWFFFNWFHYSVSHSITFNWHVLPFHLTVKV